MGISRLLRSPLFVLVALLVAATASVQGESVPFPI